MDDRLFGRRYRTTEKIGSGGMAEVYKAKDDVLGRTVAVKVLHSQYAQEEGFVKRFRQEAQAAANLSHPNIVNIYDWGRDDDETYYIVMEFVRGTDLKSMVDRHGPIAPKEAAEYATQVCSALSVAHGYGVIHRDIKPHNLVLMHDGTVKVMDFGIARAGDTTMTQTGSVLGTAQYVSPEQAQGRELGPGTDLYSLGVVLYELTTGKLPFTGDSAITVALKQVNEQPLPPSTHAPDIPTALEAIIMTALRKDPAERYHSADEMKSDLKRFTSGEQLPAAAVVPPISAVSAADRTRVMPAVEAADEQFVSGSPRDVRKPPRRRTGWIWAAAIVVALTLAGAAIAWALGLFTEVTYIVPSVVGMMSEEASETIQVAGLVLGDVETVFSDTVAEGKVVSQDPSAGESVEASAAVDLTVSGGEEMFEVPDLVGLTEVEAITAIREAGLVLETIQREHSGEIEDGIVMRQTPEGLEQVIAGTPVTIVVSAGTELVKVPDVVGKTKTEARALIEDVGLTVEIVEAFSDTVDKNDVISQSPNEGVSIETGRKVTITVSKGQDLVIVPNVLDYLEADAIEDIQAAGLVPAILEQIVLNPGDVGLVLGQSPIGDASVPRGSTVTITVGRMFIPPGP